MLRSNMSSQGLLRHLISPALFPNTQNLFWKLGARSYHSIKNQPSQTKYRKAFKGRVQEKVQSTGLVFGRHGLQALEPGKITAKQIEATRQVISRHMKPPGQVWIRIFPDVPVSKKPQEVRMGKGKGDVELYIARVPAGKIMYEIEVPNDGSALEVLRAAAAKLPLKTRIVSRVPGSIFAHNF
eukprot:TRINITY_DN4002_c0_g1_i1.p1 TRINITY_DN4002_c0_g1~~TRINITY_DN4002_c0_g1_i1.p1  ORF type:complete len:183 (+),score=32.35 TRINITY_DN4002_c0_g1_i1:47-595(+)